jgi:hypothetical protein
VIISGISVTESLCFCTTVFILAFGFGFYNLNFRTLTFRMVLEGKSGIGEANGGFLFYDWTLG